MTRSSHERYRDALTALAGDAAILPIVSEAGERCGWWTSERTWHRTYGRFMPDAGAFAEIVVSSDTPSQQLCRIEMFERRPDGRGPGYVWTPAFGWARVTRFPFDPALPGLPPVAAGATVVRYHPGRRCTLRTVRDGRTVFAKVYATNKGCASVRGPRGPPGCRLARRAECDDREAVVMGGTRPGRSGRPRFPVSRRPGDSVDPTATIRRDAWERRLPRWRARPDPVGGFRWRSRARAFAASRRRAWPARAVPLRNAARDRGSARRICMHDFRLATFGRPRRAASGSVARCGIRDRSHRLRPVQPRRP